MKVVSFSSFLFIPLFFLVSTLVVSSCVDADYVATPTAAAAPNLLYEPFRGTMEMDDDFNLYLGASNSKEFESDIEISVGVGEGYIAFAAVEFDFDLEESTVHGANACQAFGGHCSDKSTVKLLYFEPTADFWSCLNLENCDPDDEVFVFELFLRKSD